MNIVNLVTNYKFLMTNLVTNYKFLFIIVTVLVTNNFWFCKLVCKLITIAIYKKFIEPERCDNR